MTRSIFSATASFVLLLAFTVPVTGQQGLPPSGQEGGGFAVDVRGAYGIPVEDLSDALGAESDWGFGAGVALGLTPGFGIYGGWARDRFDCETCGSGDEIRVSGFEGGLMLLFDRAGIVPWVKAGLLGHVATIQIGDEETDSGRNLGFQGVLGVDIPFGENISIMPAIRYNHIPSEFELLDFEFEADRLDTDIQYLSIDVGIRLHTRRGIR